MENIIEQYQQDGYYLSKSALTKDFCNSCLDKLDTMEPKIFLPFGGIPWGWGQLFNIKPFNEILENPSLTSFCKSLYNTDKYNVNHLLVSNKVSWHGPEEMYHQEVCNIDTFGPGCDPNKDWKDFLQVFIALEDQTLENGCLRIIKNSHKLGMLEHEDIVWNHTGHKRRVTHKELKRAYKHGGILNCELKQGDILFFNHLLVHGSSSNQSPFDRKAVIMQVQNTQVPKDEKIFEKYNNFRKNFFINWMKEKTNSMVNNNNIYTDFKKTKK